MTPRKSAMPANRGGVCVVLLVMVLAAAATSFGGYGDLPDTFTASTGFVTLRSDDNTGAGNQSFFLAKNWSDAQPPHADTNYYVSTSRVLATPHEDAEVAAQLEEDPDCLTFKGRTLVVANRIWHLNGTYSFTFPDVRFLPGGHIHYTARKSSLLGNATVYGTSAKPTRIHFKSTSSTFTLQELGFAFKGDAASCMALSWDTGKGFPFFVRLTGDLSEYSGTLRVGTDLSATDSVGFWIATDRLGGTVELPIDQASLAIGSENGLTIGGLKSTADITKLFLGGDLVNTTTPRLTVTNSLELARPITLFMNQVYVKGTAIMFSAPVYPTEPGEYPLIRLAPETVQNGGWTKSTLTRMFVLSTVRAPVCSELLWRDDADGGKTLCLETGVLHNGLDDGSTRDSFVYPTKTSGGTDWYWSHESSPADDENSADISYFSTNVVYFPRITNYRFPGKMYVLTGVGYGINVNANNINSFDCDNLVWRGAGLHMWGSQVSYSPKRYDETGKNEYKYFALHGTLRVLSGYGDNNIRVYGGTKVARIESEVVGDGDLYLRAYHSVSAYTSARGSIEFTALNTNYTGKISVTMSTKTFADNGVSVPNWTQRATLFVADERNLGGFLRKYFFRYTLNIRPVF